MGAPMRLTQGFTQDMTWQPLGLIGQPNPFFYSTLADDFLPYAAGNYTVTLTSAGTLAATAGAGGRILATTNASTPLAADIVAIQPAAAHLVMAAAKKTAWMVRMNAAANLAVYQLGLIQKTATPATITDGMVATRVTSGTGWLFRTLAGSVVTGTVTVLDTISGFVAGTDIDIAMVYDGRGEVLVFIGNNLIGVQDDQNRANLGPIARFTPTSLPTATLCGTIAMQSGTASSTTATFDLLYAAQER